MTAVDLPHHWEYLQAWLAREFPNIFGDLNPGATPQELAKLEATLGFTLPEGLRALYLRHNGQKGEASGLFYGLNFLDINGVLRERQTWRELLEGDPDLATAIESVSIPSGAIKLFYINLGWVPFADDGGGNHLGIDLDPDIGGSVGQVINFGRDEKTKYVLASSIPEFFTWFVGELKNSNFQRRARDRHGVLALQNPEKEHLLDALPELFRR